MAFTSHALTRSTALLAASAACLLQRGVIAAPVSRSISIDTAVDVSGWPRALQPAPDPDLPITITGLTQPTSFTWDDAGWVYISEKAGLVKALNGWKGNVAGAAPILDITGHCFSWGDHGLTSVAYYQGYLYGTYMLVNPAIGQNCADYGQMDGRPLDQVVGCVTWGRLSRWPVAQGVITGPEAVLIDGTNLNEEGLSIMCAQFSTHGAASVIVGGDGNMYVTFGDGAAFTLPDVGQCGNDPCGGAPGYKGAYRSQDPGRLNGKIVRVNPNTLEVTVMSRGHRNPWRLTWFNGNLYESETGWYSVEEINLIQDGNDYGWPCYEGPDMAPEYVNFLNQEPVCQYLQNNNAMTVPVYFYRHPKPPPHAGNVMSITCLSGHNGRLYFGDYTVGWIKSIDANYGDEQIVAQGVYPIEMKDTPVGLAYVDYVQSHIVSLDVGAPLASPSPLPSAPYVRIISNQVAYSAGCVQNTWEPKQAAALTFTVDTNMDTGREGTIYDWAASLYTDCAAADCGVVAVNVAPHGTAVYTLQAPARAGTLVITVTARTYAGLSTAAAPAYVASGEAQMCACAGRPGVGDGRDGANNGAGPRSASIDTSSAAFRGGVIGAGAFVAVGAMLGVAYVLRRRMPSPGAPKPRTVTAAPNASAAGVAAATSSTGVNGGEASRAPTLLERRGGAAPLPPLEGGSSGVPSSAGATAPVKPSPANGGEAAASAAAGVAAPASTPAGERRV